MSPSEAGFPTDSGVTPGRASHERGGPSKCQGYQGLRVAHVQVLDIRRWLQHHVPSSDHSLEGLATSAKVCIRADFPTPPTTSDFFALNFLLTSAPHAQFKTMHPEEAQCSLGY